MVRDSTVPIIPDDVIKEILSRVPAKSVVRCRSVCKAWHRMLTDPSFINLHLKRSLEHGPVHILLIFQTDPVTLFLLDAENPTNMDVGHNEYPPRFGPYNHGIGSCHGLVCTTFNGHWKCVCVWNASTRKHMMFPYHGKLNKASGAYGFFYDPTCCAYKLVEVKTREDFRPSKVMLYSIDNGKGTPMDDIPYKIFSTPGVAAGSNGALHWLAYSVSNKVVVVAFNPVCQEFKEIPMPDRRIDTLLDVYIAQMCGSLSVAYTYANEYEVWLMKEYGVKQSWTKCILFPTRELKMRPFSSPPCIVPLHITKKGDLILHVNYEKVFMYDQKQKRLIRIRIKYSVPGMHLLGNVIDGKFWALTLVDSLVDIGNNHGREEDEQVSPGQGLSKKLSPNSGRFGNIGHLTFSSDPPVDPFYELNSSQDPIFVPPVKTRALGAIGSFSHPEKQCYNFQGQNREEREAKGYQNHSPSRMGTGDPTGVLF